MSKRLNTEMSLLAKVRRAHTTISNGKPIAVYCARSGNLLKYYVAGREAARRLKLTHNVIQERVGTGRTYKGYRFEFVTDERLKERIRSHFAQIKLAKYYKNPV